MTPAGTTHIYLDDRGVAWIDDTNVKVIEVVVDRVAWQWSPEAIRLQHPHLSLAQIYAALAYYYDHQAEFDAQMARDTQEVEALRAQAGESPVAKRLREAGLLK
jgi:uncharacterized protein (DUF433 family)